MDRKGVNYLTHTASTVHANVLSPAQDSQKSIFSFLFPDNGRFDTTITIDYELDFNTGLGALTGIIYGGIITLNAVIHSERRQIGVCTYIYFSFI